MSIPLIELPFFTQASRRQSCHDRRCLVCCAVVAVVATTALTAPLLHRAVAAVSRFMVRRHDQSVRAEGRYDLSIQSYSPRGVAVDLPRPHYPASRARFYLVL